MAKLSLIAKAQRKPKFSARAYNRCRLCGRPRAYMRKFGCSRLTFREAALAGLIGLAGSASLAAVAQLRSQMPDGSRVLAFNYDSGERYLSVEALWPAG